MWAAEQARVEPRTRATVRARLRDSHGSRDICVIDISSRGMLAVAAHPPKRGEFIELTFGTNHLTGQVAWASERRFGVSLRERVSVSAVAQGGKGVIELARSIGAKRRRTGTLAGLWNNPELFGKFVQFGTFAVVAATAGWVIADYLGETLAPVQAAFAGVN